MMQNLKVISLKVSNLMNISAIEISPKGNVVEITGKNGAGKSSVINSIWFAMGGKKATPEKPIKTGETSAEVTIDLGKYVVTRKWTSNESSTLKVVGKDGSITSPQALLDRIVGKLSFNPLDFINLDKKAQREALLNVVDIGIDLEDVAKKRKYFFDERTGVNRELKKKEGEIAGLEVPAGDIADEVSLSALVAEISKGNTANIKNEENRKKLADMRIEVRCLSSEIDMERTLLKEKEERLLTLTEKGLLFADEVEALQDVNTASFQEKLDSAEENNAAIRIAKAEKDKYKEVKNEVALKRAESEKLTDEIAALDLKNKTAIEGAEFPIKGLSVNETGVIFEGIPIKQVNSAEQLKVSLALAMALNPKVRVIRITDGSLLDSDNRKIIEEMAKDKDFQVWVESVDESGEVGFFIEDGEIKNGY